MKKHFLKLAVLALAIFIQYKAECQGPKSNDAPKAETQEWILSKLEKYVPKESYSNSSTTYYTMPGVYIRNYKFSFDNYNLIFTYDKQTSNSKFITYYKVTIPIYDIKEVRCSGDETLWIESNKKTIVHTTINSSQGSRVDNVAFIDFKCSSETDLSDRMSTAFMHLKKFYSKPPNNEKF